MTPGHVALVEVTRGARGVESAECIHYGSVAVVDASGKLVASAGDPEFAAFTRSTIKPFQALPFMLDDGPAHFGFAPAQVAMLCSSHSGEAEHIAEVDAMLAHIGCGEVQLRCGCHVPLMYAATNQTPAPGAVFDQRYNNCSGKHAGFLGYCRLHDLPLETYLDEGHPLQRRVRKTLAAFVRRPEDSLAMGIDGCSAPNYALPLSALALAYARLAQGSADPEYGAQLAPLFDAMTGNPQLVSGTGRHDLAFMRAAPGDWVAKVGADGVQAIGIRSAGLGIAIKVADGAARALPVAAVGVLKQLGLVDDPAASSLASLIEPPVRNARGIETGRIRCVAAIRRA